MTQLSVDKRIVVGVTGASGAVYATRLIANLVKANVETHVVVSQWGKRLLRDELDITTINAAFQELYTERSRESASGANRPEIALELRNWWQGPRTNGAIRRLFGDRDGMHATNSEISVTRYLFPDQVKAGGEEMGPPSVHRGGWTDAADYRAKWCRRAVQRATDWPWPRRISSLTRV